MKFVGYTQVLIRFIRLFKGDSGEKHQQPQYLCD